MTFTSAEQAAGYLGGMIDGEGCVEKPHLKRITIVSTDLELIQACEEACAMLGIRYRIYERVKPHGLTAWLLAIMRQTNLQLVADLVPLRCSRKQVRLRATLESYGAPKGRPCQSPGEMELRQRYIDRSESSIMLATTYGVAPHTVRRWLVGVGITPRTYSEARRLTSTRFMP